MHHEGFVNARIRARAWVGLYVVLVVAPGVVALLADPFDTPRAASVEISVALGFVAFAVIAVQFVLVSRFQASSRPFGTDALVQFHQYIGGIALALVIAHPLLLGVTGLPWSAWNPARGSLAMRSGAMALWALVLLATTTIGRRRLRLSYETWQVLHLALAILLGVSMLLHALAMRGYSSALPVRLVLLVYAVAVGLVTLHYRLLHPLRLRRRPWEVTANLDVGGSSRLLRVRPVGHAGFRFDAGQFAWLVTGRSPMWAQQHPLSIASSAQTSPDGALEFSIKALGDWSAQVVPTMGTGTRVWVDGPFGAFTNERKPSPGFVMIAGGIGIAPMRSMLLTMRDRADRRHVILFVAAHDESRLIFATEIRQWQASLNLDIVYVFEAPTPGSSGERGLVTRDTLKRHLPRTFESYHYFVCGPPGMMDAVERSLVALDVPSDSIESERFNVV
jgi:predicted ferric reductase